MRSEPQLSRVHEAARSTGAWVWLAGHPLHASALVDLGCWPYGLEGSTGVEVTGPLYPCVSMPQPRPSVVRGCCVLEPMACWVKSQRYFTELDGERCAHSPTSAPVPCSLPRTHRSIRQEGSRLCVGTEVLKGRCNKHSVSQSLIAACKKKATVFQ